MTRIGKRSTPWCPLPLLPTLYECKQPSSRCISWKLYPKRVATVHRLQRRTCGHRLVPLPAARRIMISKNLWWLIRPLALPTLASKYFLINILKLWVGSRYFFSMKFNIFLWEKTEYVKTEYVKKQRGTGNMNFFFNICENDERRNIMKDLGTSSRRPRLQRERER